MEILCRIAMLTCGYDRATEGKRERESVRNADERWEVTVVRKKEIS